MSNYLSQTFSQQAYTSGNQPLPSWLSDPRLHQIGLLQLPNSQLLAAVPEPPATSSRPSVYESICSLADLKLPANGKEVFLHTLEYAAEKGELEEGLLLNVALWGVSRVCHNYLPQVGPELADATRHLLGLLNQ